MVATCVAARRRWFGLVDSSHTDPLTGLANRAHFTAALGTELARQQRHGGHVGVLVMDVDGFKRINDECGHAAGDAVLTAVADQLRWGLRTEDLVARLGGDEFAVLLVEADDAAAESVACNLEAALDEWARSHRVRVGFSLGAATSDPRRPSSAPALVAAADAAMYAAKREHQTRADGPGGWALLPSSRAPDLPVGLVPAPQRASPRPHARRAGAAAARR